MLRLFVDFVKALDTVPREMPLRVLASARLGFPPKIASLVRLFHENLNMALEVDLRLRLDISGSG